ncbi:MAG: hypothetical protein GY787_30780 [Alteromonadales bacterium]|nr:hypothetical protein [Alteromonadales bacterium]
MLERISRIRYGEDGYIFVVNNKGVYLNHIQKEHNDKNRSDLVDSNGVMITKEIIETAQEGEGYLSYIYPLPFKVLDFSGS